MMEVPVAYWASGAKLMLASSTERGKLLFTIHASKMLVNQSGLGSKPGALLSVIFRKIFASSSRSYHRYGEYAQSLFFLSHLFIGKNIE